jgi:hypothetical protein
MSDTSEKKKKKRNKHDGRIKKNKGYTQLQGCVVGNKKKINKIFLFF